MLGLLSGRRHRVWTGVAVIAPGERPRTRLVGSILAFARLPPAQIAASVEAGEWQGCAGGYRVEGRGQALFARIEGDRTSIQGLPMQRVVRLLREAGVRFF